MVVKKDRGSVSGGELADEEQFWERTRTITTFPDQSPLFWGRYWRPFWTMLAPSWAKMWSLFLHVFLASLRKAFGPVLMSKCFRMVSTWMNVKASRGQAGHYLGHFFKTCSEVGLRRSLDKFLVTFAGHLGPQVEAIWAPVVKFLIPKSGFSFGAKKLIPQTALGCRGVWRS